jgi:CubicO group peptidase (beta-lactamase class C family)
VECKKLKPEQEDFLNKAVSNEKSKMDFPTKSWIFDKDKSESPNAFHRILPFITNKTNTTGLMVIRHGKATYKYGDTIEASYIASCRKSVLAMLYGKYVESGIIDLNMTIGELAIDDIQGLNTAEKKATILNLITSKSGIYHPASNGGDDSADAPERGSQVPGEYHLYNNWDFNAAGAIFEKLTGKSIIDALETDLAIPLGMEDFKKEDQKMLGDRKKSKHLAYHMWFSTRDMARLGYLMLREGNWNGQQIISKNWVNEMIRIHTPREQMHPNKMRDGDVSYGYMWWIFDNPKLGNLYDGAYTAAGYFGQFITVIPRLDLVIAHKTKADYLRHTTNYNELRDLIVNTIHSHDDSDIEDIKRTEQYLMDEYLGDYKNDEEDIIVKITKENGILYATSKKRGKCKLCLCGKQLYFLSKDKKLLCGFDFNGDSKVSGITVTYGEGMTKLTKLEK